jgi:small subunit ribosomal protein S18
MEKETTINAPMHHIDFKDITRLRANVNPHARMMNRRRTRMSATGQRNFARAVKRARFMALMPYLQQ